MKLQPPSIRGLAQGDGNGVSFGAGLSAPGLPVTPRESHFTPRSPGLCIRKTALRPGAAHGWRGTWPRRLRRGLREAPAQPSFRSVSVLGWEGQDMVPWVLLGCSCRSRQDVQGDTSQAWELADAVPAVPIIKLYE